MADAVRSLSVTAGAERRLTGTCLPIRVAFPQSLKAAFDRHRKPLLTLIAGALLIGAVLLSFVRGPGMRFERDAWLEAGAMDDEVKCSRGPMLRDLRKRVLQPGMNRQAVIELLGPPYAEHTTEMSYALGFCAGPNKTTSLIIRFDANGLLTGSELAGF